MALAHTSGHDAVFGLDPDKNLPWICHEGTLATDPPDTISKLFAEARWSSPNRKTVLILEGSASYCRLYRDSVLECDVIIYCVPEDVALELGLAPVDRGWREGDSPLGDVQSFVDALF